MKAVDEVSREMPAASRKAAIGALQLEIETERLHIRPARFEDLEVALPFYQDVEFRRMIEGDFERDMDLAQLELEARSMARHGYLLTLEDRATGEAIGEACLQWMNLERAEVLPSERVMRLPIAIWDRRRWSQGYGTEVVLALMKHAFTALEVDRLCAMQVAEFNERSIRLWTRCGLTLVRRVQVGDHFELDFEVRRRDDLVSGWNFEGGH